MAELNESEENSPGAHTFVVKTQFRKMSPKQLTLRRIAWMLAVVGVGLPLAWFLWGIFGWPAQILISRETTWLTEPIAEDGYIDYLPFIRNRHLPQGVAPAETDHWLQLHEAERPRGRGNTVKQIVGLAYRDPAVAFSEAQFQAQEDGDAEPAPSQFEFENEILPRLQIMPWTAHQYPVIAGAVYANEAWYADVVSSFTALSAVTYPSFSGNRDSENIGQILLPSAGTNRIFAQRFLLRAALRFGSGDQIDACRDIAFVYKIADRDRLFVIGRLVGTAIESYASRVMIAGLLSSSELAPDTIQLVSELPAESNLSSLIELINTQLRIIHLEMLQSMHRKADLSNFIVTFPGRSGELQQLLARRLRNGIDWNRILEAENQYVDSVVKAISSNSFQHGFSRLQTISAVPGQQAVNNVVQRELWQPCPSTDAVAKCLSVWHSRQVGGTDLVQQAYVTATHRLLRRRVVQVVLRLAVWKQLHGGFPESLEQIVSLPDFPGTSPEVFVDPFTDTKLVYRQTPDGFELRSLGVNGVEDNNPVGEFQPDLPRRMRPDTALDDVIWRWPAD